MSTPFSLVEARKRFSELVNRAAHGEEIVITLRGKRVARLVPTAKPEARVPNGSLVERIRRRRAQSSLGQVASIRDLIEDGRL